MGELSKNINQNLIELARGIVSGQTSLVPLEMKLSISDTLNKPLMRSVFKNDSGKIGFAVVQVLVKRFMETFGFSNKPSQSIIEIITIDTLEKFQYESLEDIILFFKMCRNGSFGPARKGIDSNLIFSEWFPKYMELKAMEREKEKQKEKDAKTKEAITIEDVMHTYTKNVSRDRLRKIKNYVDRIVKDMDSQILEDTIVSWSKDDQRKDFVYLLKSKRRQIKK